MTIDGVKAIGSAAAGSGFPAVLALSGTVHATMTPGNIADYCRPAERRSGQSTGIYATLAGSARLTVNGGIFGGAALGGSDGVNGAFNRGAFNLTGVEPARPEQRRPQRRLERHLPVRRRDPGLPDRHA